MSKIPPLLPSEALRRTLRTARFDGASILMISGLFALISAAGQDKVGTIAGLLVAGAGAIELHGSALLQNGELRGMKWLILSQLFLLATILGYVGFKLQHIDLDFWHQAWSHLTADQTQQLLMPGDTEDDYLRQMYMTCYKLVALMTIPYQGGMALYYFRRRRSIAAALAPDPA